MTFFSAIQGYAPYKANGKHTLIWFDKIVMNMDKRLIENIIDNKLISGEVSLLIADELSKIIKSIETELTDYDFSKPYFDQEPTSDSELYKDAVDAAKEATLVTHSHVKEYDSELFEDNVPGFLGFLSASIYAWHALNGKYAYSLVANKAENDFLQRINLSEENQEVGAFELFSEIAIQRVPNFNQLSWERIFELRNHPFLGNFREKIASIQGSIQSFDVKTTNEVIEEIEMYDLRELAKLCKPSPRSAIMKLIASNIPLPIPLNPISLGLGIDDYTTEQKKANKFGWLYFLMDLA